MTVTNASSGTNVHEIAEGIYRINTPVALPDGSGFSFNQYFVDDDEPLLFHTGPRRMLPLVHEAVGSVLPVTRLRHVAFSHAESDECGSLNEWLAAAPHAAPLCGQVAAMVSIGDLADRPPRAMADGEVITLGRHSLRWFDTPHLPHAWECGFLLEERTATLLCCAENCSLSRAPNMLRSPMGISSGRARHSVTSSTTSRTRSICGP